MTPPPSTRALPTAFLLKRRVSVYQRLMTTLRRVTTVRLLPPRRISNMERRSIEQRIATDPEVQHALENLLTKRPELRRKESVASPVQGQPRE